MNCLKWMSPISKAFSVLEKSLKKFFRYDIKNDVLGNEFKLVHYLLDMGVSPKFSSYFIYFSKNVHKFVRSTYHSFQQYNLLQ